MKLLSIELDNFRQFYGKQTMKFACDTKNNITVVHGENGSGKTTLLNALIWCLYGETTHDFESSDRLLNDRHFDSIKVGDRSTVSVSIIFEDNGSKYCASRTLDYIKDSPSDLSSENPRFVLSITGPDGQTRNPDNPLARITQILPEEMLNYFFFNGERIERLSQKKNANEIQRAIKTILGLTILERSVEHLSDVQRALRKTLQEANLVSEKGKNLLSEYEKVDQELVQKRSDVGQLIANIESLKSQSDEIQKRLRELEGSKGLQELRDQIVLDTKNLAIDLSRVNQEISSFIRTNGYASFTARLFQGTAKVLEDMKAKNVLPPDVKENFIKEILKELTCICGREITKGSKEFKSIEKLLQISGREDTAVALSNFQREAYATQQRLNNNPQGLRTLLERRAALEREIHKKEERRDEISGRLSKFEGAEDIAKLESRYQDNDQAITREENARVRLVTEIEEKEKLSGQLRKEVDKITAKDDAGRRVKAELDAAEQLELCAKEIYGFHISEIRRTLAEKIDLIFQKICKKNYFIRMNEDFTLDVLSKQGSADTIVSKGTGENQITSLSFVGSLLDYARERSTAAGNNSELTFTGGIYPLVMDSPFGSLDSDYREDIATYIPQLSPQVAVFVSTTQWRGEVERALTPRLGKRYVLVNFTPKKKQPIVLDVGGTTYHLIEQSEKYEYTQILEIT